MILHDETFNAYGYWPNDLKHKSQKLVLVQCENPDCGEIRTVQRGAASRLCRPCALLARKARSARADGKPHKHLHLLQVMEGKIEAQKEAPCRLCKKPTARTNKLCMTCEDKIYEKMHEINERRYGIRT